MTYKDKRKEKDMRTRYLIKRKDRVIKANKEIEDFAPI
jgi:hypothetical protein